MRPAGMAVRTAVPRCLLTRKGSQVQTLSRPPQFSQVRALSVLGGQRSSCAAAALRPRSSPPNPTGSSDAGQRGPSPTTTTTERSHHLLVQPCGRASTQQPAQDAHAGGLVRTCFLSCFPANRPGALPLDQPLGRPGGERGAAASGRRSGGQACRRRSLSHVRPSPLAPGLSWADDRQRGCRRLGHRTRGRPDVRIAPVALDTGHVDTRRPSDHWTDARTADRERGQRDDRHGRCPDTLDGHGDRDHPLG
jgi:hypothetical protein